MDPEVITAHAYRVVIDDRIAQLWRYRRWWRTHRWAEHPLRRQEMDVELRALVRLARKARDLSRPALERLDAVTMAQAEEDLAAGDFYAWPEDFVHNVEGDPAFNGSFR